jgi:prolyl-tRNA editing enzyme YbaK/EbsC (Cys-tRNA(Pro) deacylase)
MGFMTLPRAAQRVVEAAREQGLEVEVRRFPKGTKTAAEAAGAVGCPVAAIVKSLVFVVDGRPVVALVPGDRRLDPDKLARTVGGRSAHRASLEEVRRATGYAAGGTPPLGHDLPVLADTALRRHQTVWAAAGTPDTVFEADLEALVRAAGAEWAELS